MKCLMLKQVEMKHLFIIRFILPVTFLFFSLRGVAQINDLNNSIGISIPVIWNNSEATYYRLGSPKYPSGNGLSYGLNVNYSFFFYKGIYAKIGAGYFRQTFGIIRPFFYASPIQFGWATNSYSYDNVQLFGGIGYKEAVSKVISINGAAIYSQYYSFRQKYINHSPVSYQMNHKSITIGRVISLDIGAERKISKCISVAVDLIIPVYNHWNNDEIFAYYGYSDDAQQIARNRFSLGAAFSCYYNF